MTDFELIDQLLDKSLNGEATEEDLILLQGLAASSEELTDYYFSAVDQQLSLKQHFENEIPQPKKPAPQKKTVKFPWKIIISAAAIIAVMLFVTFSNKPKSTAAALSISNESFGISLIRNQEEIDNPFAGGLQSMDLIQVDQDGELWLDMKDGSRLFADGGSQLKIQHKVSEHFLLIKGSVSGDIQPQKKPISFLTKDTEIKVIGTKFKVQSGSGISELSVTEGLVQMTRLKDGKKIEVPRGKRADSKHLKIKEIPESRLSIFPSRENGVKYRYYQRGESLSNLKGNLIDSGITTALRIKRGDHEGCVRRQHDVFSYVALKNFTVELKSFVKIDREGRYSFRLNGKYESILEIGGQTVAVPEQGGSEIIKLQMTEGFYPVRILTRGILEPDHEDWALRVDYYVPGSNSFKDIPEDKLFYSNRRPLNKVFKNDISQNLSAHLPLRGNFEDTVNRNEAAAQGKPQFVEDDKAGTVCQFDGISAALTHLPAGKLGLTGDYTAACWVKLQEGGHYDQVILSSSQNQHNSTLVLLSRRMHPYLAHLNNDTVADERLPHRQWTHLAFRFHAGQQSIFLNGKLAVSSNNHSNLNNDSPLVIGAWRNRFLKGRLRDLRIYNTALHKDDITLIYEKTKTGR